MMGRQRKSTLFPYTPIFRSDFGLPAYTVADAFASYETRVDAHKVRLQLNVKNLFDKVYYSSAVNQYFVALGDARQVSLSSTLEF